MLNCTGYLVFRRSDSKSLVNKNPTNETKEMKHKMLYCDERANFKMTKSQKYKAFM